MATESEKVSVRAGEPAVFLYPGLVFVCFLFGPFLNSAEARNPYLKNFFKAYPPAKGTVLETVPSHPDHCGVCHYSFGGGGPKNPYGEAVEATDRSTSAISGLGDFDSDGDGFSNDIEITDTRSFSNTPTFPGLKPANLGMVSNVNVSEIQSHLVPSVGSDTMPPSVTLISPNGGETVTGNQTAVIEWTASDEGGIAAIDLHLSLDGGLTFAPIVLGIGNTGTYEWFPANRPTAQAVVRVTAIDNAYNSANDDSDSVFSVFSPPGGLAPTTLRDFDMPGTQPFESGVLNDPQACKACHGDYDPNAEPYYNWQGSMMSAASHDLLFLANMAIANQDAPDSGDLCLRCHLPRGWLQGRSVPTDGSAMLPSDKKGVSCDLCHRLVDPFFDASESPAEDENILAALSNPSAETGNGMYVIDPTGARRGPFSDAAAGHPVLVSPFHREAALCGTCHDVSNTAFERDPNGNYVPNAFDAPATDFSATRLMPVERTYSEWLHSTYNSPTGVYAPQFGGNSEYVATCQDCHMRDITGKGCNPAIFEGIPQRSDLPLHDMTGGSTWLPGLMDQLHPGQFDPNALLAGIERARYMLRNAAGVSYLIDDGKLKVTVINNTGHKLPTGYPEGRRMWINVKFYNRDGALIHESGAYDNSTGILTQDDEAKIYEVKPGLDATTADLASEPVGPSFHFVLNNKVYKDNRIPPRGFTNAAFTNFGGAPVAHSYEDGQYWDDTYYDIPEDATSATVTLYYQGTSKEFIEFLRDRNTTNALGQQMYDVWNDNGKCPPEIMASVTGPVTDLDGNGVDFRDFSIFAADWLKDCDLESCNETNLDEGRSLVDYADLIILLKSWLWDK